MLELRIHHYNAQLLLIYFPTFFNDINLGLHFELD